MTVYQIERKPITANGVTDNGALVGYAPDRRMAELKRDWDNQKYDMQHIGTYRRATRSDYVIRVLSVFI